MRENEFKGLAILAGELFPEQRDLLVSSGFFRADQMNDIYLDGFHIVLFDIGTFNYGEKDNLIKIGCRVTQDPDEFMAYVAQKTGKEWKSSRWPDDSVSRESKVFVPPGIPSEKYKNIKEFIRTSI